MAWVSYVHCTTNFKRYVRLRLRRFNKFLHGLIVNFFPLPTPVISLHCVTSFKVVKFLESDPEIRIDPMATIFPRVTKCSYFKYGPSGTVQTHDAICVLVSANKVCLIKTCLEGCVNRLFHAT